MHRILAQHGNPPFGSELRGRALCGSASFIALAIACAANGPAIGQDRVRSDTPHVVAVTTGPLSADSANANALHALTGGIIEAVGSDIRLTAATTTGALAESAGRISVTTSSILTTSTTVPGSAGQTGIRANGTGSAIAGTGVTVRLGPGTTTLNTGNLAGVIVEAGATADLTGSTVEIRGGATGANNRALLATGAGSRLDFTGAVTIRSANGSGAAAAAGGAVMLGSGTTIATMGNSTSGGSATGGSRLDATNLRVTTEGTGAIGLSYSASQGQLSGLTINTLAATAHGLRATADPTAIVTATDFAISVNGQNAHGVYALDGGAIDLSSLGSTVVNGGQFGNALRAEGTGSTIAGDGLVLSTLRNGGIGAHALGGGTVTLSDTTLYAAGLTLAGAGGTSAIGLQASLDGRIVAYGGRDLYRHQAR